ncbi:MAG: beta-galactosidase trimerization domain-containing protein, partial [Clostridia bacterium]
HEKLRSTEQFGSSQKEFDGICEILSRSHIQFSIIDENNLIRDDLSVFKLIILPNTVCLDSSAAQCVKRYVSGGGNLISTLYSGACDENGVSRPENTLSDVIGAVSAPQRVSYFAGGGYLSVDCGADVSCNPTAGFAGPVVRTRYSEDCQILARMHEPMDGRYSAFKDATYPAIVEHTYGAGKSLYIAGGIGATYKDFGVMDYSELVRTFALRYITPLIKVEGAYESIDILVREQAERTFVHMLNYTGTMRRPIEHTIPCRDISVAVQANNNVTRVHTMLGGKELPFTMSDGMVCVNVDLESAYEVIIFE